MKAIQKHSQAIAIIALAVLSTAAVGDEGSAKRDIALPATPTTTAPKNPSVSTTGTLTILQSVAFAATATSSSKAAISYSWDFGDGSAPDTRQNPTHVFTVPKTYTASRLLSAFDFKKTGKDQLKLSGILRVPTNLKQPEVSLDIGGITAKFNLDERGWSEIKASDTVVSGKAVGEKRLAAASRYSSRKKRMASRTKTRDSA